MSPSYQDSLAIFEAFDKRHLPLFIAYYRLSLPRFIQIKEWLEAKEIGAIRHINWVLTKSPSKEDLSDHHVLRTDHKIAPGGYFEDLASHVLDLFTYYLGTIEMVNGISLNQQDLYSARDAVVVS